MKLEKNKQIFLWFPYDHFKLPISNAVYEHFELCQNIHKNWIRLSRYHRLWKLFWIFFEFIYRVLRNVWKSLFVKRAVDSDFDTSKRPFQTQFMNTSSYDKIFIKIELNWADIIDDETGFESFLSSFPESQEMFENGFC